MRATLGAVLVAVLLAACGCAHHAELLGKLADETRAPLVAVSGLKPGTGQVTLKGVMVEKCPVAACWFRLRDETGVVKVDLKAAGFTVTDLPVNTVVTVTGTPRTDGGDSYLSATGLRY